MEDMWDPQLKQGVAHIGNIDEPLKALPKRLSPRLPVTIAAKKAVELCGWVSR
jgi:hypothetical protein